jgi:hypothetical protein
MRLSYRVRRYGWLVLWVFLISGVMVYAFMNLPTTPLSGNQLVAIPLPATYHSMDAGANAPWLESGQIPVTGSLNAPMDAGAGAPWLMNGQSMPAGDPGMQNNRSLRVPGVPTSTARLNGVGR